MGARGLEIPASGFFDEGDIRLITDDPRAIAKYWR
jgi:hypothetical protein